MTTNFPGGLDSFTNPIGTDTVSSEIGGRTHSEKHADVNDAIETLEAKVGVNGSAVTTSHDYKLSGVTGSDMVASRTGTETLAGKTLTLPKINDTSSNNTYNVAVNELAADRTITLPLLTNNDTFVFQAHTQTLTNKTINGAGNTLTVLAATQLSGATPIANGGTGQITATLGFNALSPLTTKGDSIWHNGTNNVRVAIGANDTIPIADSSNGNGFRWDTIGSIASGKLNISTTPITVGNTASVTTLFSTTIAGGTLGTNSAIKIRVFFSAFAATGGNTIDIRLRYGGSTIATVSISGITVTSNGAYYEGYLIASGATNTQKGLGHFYSSTNGGETAGAANVGPSKTTGFGSGTGAVDSTASQTLLVDVQWNTAIVGSTLTAEAWVVSSIK